MPIGCSPFGRVAEINGMIHVGYGNTMYRLKDGKWDEKTDPRVVIWNVFESEGKGYVMDWGSKNIYEWKSEKRDLELLTEIPEQLQIDRRSAIGHDGKIYLVGGWLGSDKVSCFDVHRREWKPIKEMKKERWDCSLAVIDDKMFVGGGFGAGNSFECLLMNKEKWIDVKPATKEWCQLSSWNGKLVATGGWKNSSVEMYDELSGEWLPLPSMNRIRNGHGACTTKDDRLVVVGGVGAKDSAEYLKL